LRRFNEDIVAWALIISYRPPGGGKTAAEIVDQAVAFGLAQNRDDAFGIDAAGGNRGLDAADVVRRAGGDTVDFGDRALALNFLPRAIADFRKTHPKVEFDVKVVDHEYAMSALSAFEVDLVMVFRPPFLANFQPLMTLEQRLVAVMAKTHPLAKLRKLRLRDCAAHPVALPERSIGGRQLLDEVAARTGLSFNIATESNSFELLRGLVIHAGLLSFQISIGTMPIGHKLGLVAREIDDRDVPSAKLVFGQLRERNLPVATAVFAQHVIRRLEAMQ
jgi:DNA-binding transcriptional LysR family regulator